MRGFRLTFGLMAVALAALAATACGGGSGSVKLAWQPSHGTDLQLAAANGQNPPVYQTVIYMSNETNETLRDARVRFRPDAAVNAPIGFHIGTVAQVSSQFEGEDQVWPVGDLAPGAHVSMPLGLWFDLDHATHQDNPVELTLDLVSRDLTTDVASNALKVHLSP